MKMTTIIRIIFFIIGMLVLANVVLLLRVSNPTVGFALQAMAAVVVMAYAVFFNYIPKKIHIALGISSLIPIIFVLFLGIYGNVSNTTYNEDVVIVLGAGIIGETVTRPLASRLNTAFYYWQKNPNAYIIVCGGLGNRAIITEAEAMARFLIRRGVPPEKILLEDRSTSTYENLTFAKEILDEHFPYGFRAVLVTNDFHIYRAINTAHRIGIDANRMGAPTDWYTWPVNYLREMLAVVYMWVFA